jgi:regulator of protease activity HflC (stomatin/prohibitin superfamily)
MRSFVPFVCLACAGCASTVVEPGHRGLYFDKGGLHHEVLNPGRYRVGVYSRVDDFDITYSTRKEEVKTTSSEGLQLELRLAVIFRPIQSELYELDTEIGPNFYDEVIGPEFRSAARGVFARHSYLDLQKMNEKIEDEVEHELRRRTAGKHIEISSVTLEGIGYAPEIAAAVRSKLVGEQEALRQKAALEAEALKRKLEIEHKAEQDKLSAEAAVLEKRNERRIAEEEAALAKVQAEAEAQTRIVRAKAEAEERTMLAKAAAAERKAEAQALTPLSVMMHGYDALAQLAGGNTTILLGDWSKVPSFLFPRGGFLRGSADLYDTPSGGGGGAPRSR